ncbi:MAG: bifunctional lysine ketoglutarate reductase /saccharopine dehydrogenase family protein [Bacteroidales bacterium]
MSERIGIRHEDKYVMERRTALTPRHIKMLKERHNLEFVVQTSPKRVFKDEEYLGVGAEVAEKLSKCPIIMGVKEIPVDFFEKNKTYIFFSHVIKGQPYNMPMLKKMMELGCNLIDYEKVADEQGRRLIFFGKFAGLAGMINSLWSLGQRLKVQGYTDNPFLKIKQSYQYDSLAEAKKEISEAGREIAEKGLPRELLPLTIGFTGYGNVSIGAQEIAALLPIKEISPEELLELQNRKNLPDNIIYKTIFQEKHISKPKDNSHAFELQDYYKHPEKYENNFEQYIPNLTILMNCMYWDTRYPRIFTKEFARKLYQNGEPKIKVIGDVTCDPDGSIEFTHKGTEIEDPVFVYDPHKDEPKMGFKGDGILVMAVDILPSELPRDSSEAFGDALVNFIKPIADADFTVEFKKLLLPAPIKKATILLNGKLTPDYEYIEQYL